MKITRTIKTTAANIRLYNPETDTLEVESVAIAGTFKSKQLFLKAAAKERKDGKTVLGCDEITTSERLYACTLEDFLSVATPAIKSEAVETE